MRYLLALFLPWLVFFTMGKVIQGIICLVLQITVIGWLPATIWAFMSISDYNRKKDTDRIVNAIKENSK
jgi:uncharacterized membrane protein YqaE (UPF0057 family)